MFLQYNLIQSGGAVCELYVQCTCTCIVQADGAVHDDAPETPLHIVYYQDPLPHRSQGGSAGMGEASY